MRKTEYKKKIVEDVVISPIQSKTQLVTQWKSGIQQNSHFIFINDGNEIKSLMLCKWLVVCTSCIFLTLLSWDIAGDKEKWNGAIWVPFTGLGIIIILWIINYVSVKIGLFTDPLIIRKMSIV